MSEKTNRVSRRTFMVNTGAATAADVLALIEHARAEVKRQFGVEMELEIELVGW